MIGDDGHRRGAVDRDLLLFAATANSFAETVPVDFFDFRFRSFGLACLLVWAVAPAH